MPLPIPHDPGVYVYSGCNLKRLSRALHSLLQSVRHRGRVEARTAPPMTLPGWPVQLVVVKTLRVCLVVWLVADHAQERGRRAEKQAATAATEGALSVTYMQAGPRAP